MKRKLPGTDEQSSRNELQQLSALISKDLFRSARRGFYGCNVCSLAVLLYSPYRRIDVPFLWCRGTLLPWLLRPLAASWSPYSSQDRRDVVFDHATISLDTNFFLLIYTDPQNEKWLILEFQFTRKATNTTANPEIRNLGILTITNLVPSSQVYKVERHYKNSAHLSSSRIPPVASLLSINPGINRNRKSQ